MCRFNAVIYCLVTQKKVHSLALFLLWYMSRSMRRDTDRRSSSRHAIHQGLGKASQKKFPHIRRVHHMTQALLKLVLLFVSALFLIYTCPLVALLLNRNHNR